LKLFKTGYGSDTYMILGTDTLGVSDPTVLLIRAVIRDAMLILRTYPHNSRYTNNTYVGVVCSEPDTYLDNTRQMIQIRRIYPKRFCCDFENDLVF